MPAPVFFADQLAAEALTRIKAGIAAAAPGDPLHGVFVPLSRWQEIPDGTLAALVVFSSGETGDGISHQLPEFQVVETIQIIGEALIGREDGLDLDQLVGQMIRAVLELLLEDPTFLKLFGWVASLNIEKQEIETGKDATFYDGLAFRIQLELAGAQTLYTPHAGTPFQIADVKTTTGDVGVESEITLQQ